MSKSIKSIIVLVLLVIAFWGILYGAYLGMMYAIITPVIKSSASVQNTSIKINDDKIEVVEDFSYVAHIEQHKVSFKRTLYVNEENSEYKCKMPENIKVYLNNKLLKNRQNVEISYYLTNEDIVIQKLIEKLEQKN